MFIANVLLKPSSSLGNQIRTRLESDFVLLQAVRGTNRAQKIHYLSIFEHFMSTKSGRIIKPTHKYFQEDGELTKLGCMVFHERIFRETGLKM